MSIQKLIASSNKNAYIQGPFFTPSELLQFSLVSTSLSHAYKLHLLEKMAVRAILSVPFDTHTPRLYKELRLIPLPKLYEYTLLTR